MTKKIYIITLIGKTMHEDAEYFQNVELFRPECPSMKHAVELTIEKAIEANTGQFIVKDVIKSIRMLDIDLK